MIYKNLGHSDIKVSTICLGTMTWGEQNTENEAFQQMDMAFEYGVNFFDTAELYPIPPCEKTQGETSRIISRWIRSKNNRDKIIIADKIVGRSKMDWFRDDTDETRLNKKQIKFALDRSLKNLNTDYIDLYQLHWPDRPLNVFSGLEYRHKQIDDVVSILETLNCLTDLIKEGKIRSFGISNETAWGTCEFVKTAETKKLENAECQILRCQTTRRIEVKTFWR